MCNEEREKTKTVRRRQAENVMNNSLSPFIPRC